MKRIYVAQNQVEAQLVRDRLDASGIRAVIKVDTLAAPAIPFPTVWVNDGDAQRARDVIDMPQGPPAE
jgi:hypothetical protein